MIIFHALNSTKYFMVTVLVDTYWNQSENILDFTAPAVPQVNIILNRNTGKIDWINASSTEDSA